MTRPRDLPPYIRFIKDFSFLKPVLGLLVTREIGAAADAFLEFKFHGQADVVLTTLFTFAGPLYLVANTRLDVAQTRAWTG